MENTIKKTMETAALDILESKGYTRPVCIGCGSFSRVYRVFGKKDGKAFACKVSQDSAMARREAMLLKMAGHKLFPRYETCYMQSGMVLLLMEYICGSSLQEYRYVRGVLSPVRAAEIALALAGGLSFLHSRSLPVIFRDLKPENVIITQSGEVRLVDMGCACFIEQPQGLAGSRGFSAPEQFVPGCRPGAESDVYAVGKLLEFMLSEENGKRRRKKGRLYQITENAVQREPRKRFPDMDSLRQELEEFIQTGEKGRVRYERDFYYVKNVRKGVDG